MHARALILDLGDVLFHWDTSTLTALPATILHAVLLSPTWGAYERGELNEEQALEQIGVEFSLSSATVSEALDQCRKTLRVDNELVEQLKNLKMMKGRLMIYAITNISSVDYALLKTVLQDWSLFDGVFTSFRAKMRKPDLGFYKHVLGEINAVSDDPSKIIFVDDKIDNVIAARAFGMTGIIFDFPSALVRKLHNLLGDPVERGKKYMSQNARKHMSTVENGPSFHDTFAQFLIYEVTGDSSLINLAHPKAPTAKGTTDQVLKAMREARTWNYFIGRPVGTTKTFPDDVDTTSCALLAFSPPASSADNVLDAMLANRNNENLVQTYWDTSRPRVDPVVLTNVVRAFYKYGRGADVRESLEHVRQTLIHRGYIDGTLHYYSAESFLFFVSRLVAANLDAPNVQTLRKPLAEALRQRVGRRDDSLAIAMRILACQTVGVWAESDIEYLKELQEMDGGWEIGWVCRYGRSRKRIGNRGVVTTYAIKALETDLNNAIFKNFYEK